MYVGTTRFAHDADQYESALFEGYEPEMRAITINMPLFQGIVELSIGLNEEAIVTAPHPYDNEGKIILYGTSITQGGCASRPGMAYSNILSRRFNLEFLNLGFSGNGKGDPEIAELISEIENPSCIILDYDTNCAKIEELIQTMPEFIRIIRRWHNLTPIRRIVSRIPFGFEHEHAKRASYHDRMDRMSFQSGLVKELQSQGDSNIYFCNGGNLLGEIWNECTVDGIHLSDLGFMQIANGLTPILKDILKAGE